LLLCFSLLSGMYVFSICFTLIVTNVSSHRDFSNTNINPKILYTINDVSGIFTIC
jgi:hypothetical protein